MRDLKNDVPARLVAVPVLGGLAIAVYLTIVHYAGSGLYCLGLSGCDEVNQSPYATVAGIPVALLGAGLCAVMLGVLWAEHNGRTPSLTARPLLFGLALAGVLYYAYLTYLELAVIRAVCVWCVTSAALTVIIFVLAVLRLRALFVQLRA
ncbi:MAG: vitamin K epoxide reductase family protein [Anaerolineales bacterium]